MTFETGQFGISPYGRVRFSPKPAAKSPRPEPSTTAISGTGAIALRRNSAVSVISLYPISSCSLGKDLARDRPVNRLNEERQALGALVLHLNRRGEQQGRHFQPFWFTVVDPQQRVSHLDRRANLGDDIDSYPQIDHIVHLVSAC